jgi:two-component system response regulator HydG
VEAFAPDAIELLLEYAWPGNVRELEHLVERVVVLGRSARVTAAELPLAVRTRAANPTLFSGPVLPIREVQRRYAAWAFQQLEGRRMVTAEKLGIDDKTLARWLADEQANQ